MRAFQTYVSVIFLAGFSLASSATAKAEDAQAASWRACTVQKAKDLYRGNQQAWDKQLRNAIVEVALSQCHYDLAGTSSRNERMPSHAFGLQKKADFKQQRKALRELIDTLLDMDALEGL